MLIFSDSLCWTREPDATMFPFVSKALAGRGGTGTVHKALNLERGSAGRVGQGGDGTAPPAVYWTA